MGEGKREEGIEEEKSEKNEEVKGNTSDEKMFPVTSEF